MHGENVATVPDYGDASQGAGEPPRLINKRNAARMLGITEREVERRIAADDLEAVKLGRRCLVVLESLDAYVAKLRGRAAA
jgi:excisionase family DNA binding protein